MKNKNLQFAEKRLLFMAGAEGGNDKAPPPAEKKGEKQPESDFYQNAAARNELIARAEGQARDMNARADKMEQNAQSEADPRAKQEMVAKAATLRRSAEKLGSKVQALRDSIPKGDESIAVSDAEALNRALQAIITGEKTELRAAIADLDQAATREVARLAGMTPPPKRAPSKGLSDATLAALDAAGGIAKPSEAAPQPAKIAMMDEHGQTVYVDSPASKPALAPEGAQVAATKKEKGPKV